MPERWSPFFGAIVTWVLVRYRFPGRRLMDALVDFPFALPTAVAGITLTSLYAPNGWLGAPLERLGVKVAFTPLGITSAVLEFDRSGTLAGGAYAHMTAQDYARLG